ALRPVLPPALSHRSRVHARDLHRLRCPRRGGGARGVKTVLHTESSPGLGGQEVRTITEARWTRERGWRVLVAGQPGGRFVERAREAGLETFSVRMRAAWGLPPAWALARIIHRGSVDLVPTPSSIDASVGRPAPPPRPPPL